MASMGPGEYENRNRSEEKEMKKTDSLILFIRVLFVLAAIALASIAYYAISQNRWNSIGDTKMAEANREQIRNEQEKQARLSLEVLYLTLEKERVLKDAEKLNVKIRRLEALQRIEKVDPKIYDDLQECNHGFNELAIDFNNCLKLKLELTTYIEYLESIQETDKQIIENQEGIIASGKIENSVLEGETRRLRNLVTVARKKTKILKAAAFILSVTVGILLLGK